LNEIFEKKREFVRTREKRTINDDDDDAAAAADDDDDPK